MSIRLLGGIEIDAAGRVQSFSARTQLGLVLCVLARRSNERVSTAELSEVLWPHSRPATYRNIIQVVVSKLRTVLETAGGEERAEVVAINDGYVLRCQPDAVDACAFDALVARALQELSTGGAPEARRLLADAMAMWGEPFGGHEPDGLETYASQLRRRRRDAASALFEVDVQLGVEDLTAIEQAVEDEPLDERLWGFLMIALYRRGRQADALRAYGRAREVLAEQIGVEPGPFLRAVEQEVLLQEGPHLTPSAGSTPGGRRLLLPAPPAAMTEVLFRSGECAAVEALLARSRFVSLVGAPGVGKTTVAAEVARAWTATPVAWLGLGDLAPTDACVTDVAVRLGVVTEADAEQDAYPSALQSLIGDRPLLVVLDNVEHVVGAIAPFITQLLQGCRNVTVLTTSRRELGEPAERVVPLRPFDVDHTEEDLSRSAEYLAVHAGLDAPGRDDADALNRIASDLGGIALALDLAAAQIRRLGATVVGSHLDILPLASGSKLDEAISWSLAQVPASTRSLVEALVHLDGPWPLPRAVAIGAQLGLDEAEVLVACSGLVEHSLLMPPAERSRIEGWRILEPVRQYVSARTSSPTWATTRTMVAAAIVAEAEQLGRLLEGGDQSAGVAGIRALMPDIRSTMAWAVEAEQPALVARLLVALRAAWWTTGLYADGQTLHQRASPLLERWRPDDPAELDASILARASIALTRPGFGANAQYMDVIQPVLADAIRAGARPAVIGWVAHIVAIGVAFTNAEPEEGVEVARVAVEHARAAGDPWVAGWALLSSALANGRVDPLTALSLFEESAASFVSAGDLLSAARVSMFRAHGLRIFGVTRDSDAALAQARDWCADIDAAPVTRLDCELGIAQNRRAAGDLEDAARRFRALIPQLTAVGDLRCAAAAEHELASILLADGDVDGANALALHATEILRRVGGEETEVAAADLVLAAVALRREEFVAAARLLGRARRGAFGGGIPLELSQLETMDALETQLRDALGDQAFEQIAAGTHEWQRR